MHTQVHRENRRPVINFEMGGNNVTIKSSTDRKNMKINRIYLFTGGWGRGGGYHGIFTQEDKEVKE